VSRLESETERPPSPLASLDERLGLVNTTCDMSRAIGPLIAVFFLLGCAGRAPQGDAASAPLGWFPIERSDFPTRDVAQGKPTVRGSAILVEAAKAYGKIATLAKEKGIPDAIAVDQPGSAIELAYLESRTAYRFSESAIPVIPFILSVGRVSVGSRPLAAEEIEEIEPEKRLARDIERLRAFLADYGRLLGVARKVMLSVPTEPGAKPGHSYGMLVLPVDRVTGRLFGHEPDASGVIVVWVDPDGPSSGTLEVGDRIVEVDGAPVGQRPRTGPPAPGTVRTAKLIRGGEELEVSVAAERWPRQVTFVPVPFEVPNAFAVEGTVAVTTGLLHLLENDDEVAVVVGHELGHIILHHVEPKVTAGRVLKGVVGVSVLLPAEIVLPGSGQLLGGMIQGVENRFNRDQERDADRWGVRLAYAAGYDPRAGITLLDELEKEAPVGDLSQFFSIHPPYPERREIVREEIERLEERAP
jgi:Peptidase family M48